MQPDQTQRMLASFKSSDTNDIHVSTFKTPTVAHKCTAGALIGFVAVACWTVVLWMLMIGKIVMSENGAAEYFRHFTNWSWTLSALFFALDLIAYLLPWHYGPSLRFWLVSNAFWLVNGTAWLVFWVVFVILNDNPSLLTNISESGGYSLGFVYCMDRIFHVLPPLVLWIYAIARTNYFHAALLYWRLIVRQVGTRGHVLWALYVIFSTVTPTMLLLVYWLMFDLKTVYGISSSPIVLVVIGGAVLIATNLIPLTLLYNSANDTISSRDQAIRIVSHVLYSKT